MPSRNTSLLAFASVVCLCLAGPGRAGGQQPVIDLSVDLIDQFLVNVELEADDNNAIDLFNGKDLTGWTYHLRDPDAKMEDVWRVEDGVLICKGRPIGYIRTKEDYGDYVLTLQWRWPAGSEGGNSGVLVHTSTPGAIGVLKIVVPAGEAITFVNESSDVHTVTADESSLPRGGDYFSSGGHESERAARRNMEGGFIKAAGFSASTAA
jgi:hypothetical protein